MASPEIDEIKARLSINDVVGQYVTLQKAGRNWRARCPFHKERTPSFMVSPERGTYVCFGCGEKGDIFSFVEKMESIDFRVALEQLADRAGVVLTKMSPVSAAQKSQEDRLKDRLLACTEAATQFFQAELQKRIDVQDYIKKRAVSEATMATWRIGYAPASWDALSQHLVEKGFTKEEIVGAGLAANSEKKRDEVYDRFRGRIMFPMFDNAGKVIAFSGRFFENVAGSREAREGIEPAKYVNSPETILFKKSRVLYGLHAAKETIRKADCILLVEGQFDVVLSHQAGLRFAVAVSGTALTPEHLQLLARYSKRLVMALDNDAAGLRSGLKSAQMALGMGFDVKVPKLPDDCKDPADTVAKDPELLKAAVRESRTAIEFFLDALRNGMDESRKAVGQPRDERAYKKIVEVALLPLVAALPSRIDQAHFVTIVANRLRVPEDAVRVEVSKTRTRVDQAQTDAAETPVVQSNPADVSLTRLEKAAAMIVVQTSVPATVRSRLIEVLGGDRVKAIEGKAAPYAEEMRFRFESMGGDAAANSEQTDADLFASLLLAVEREHLDEQIAAVRGELANAQSTGDSTKEAELLKKMHALVQQKHSLKK